jgi:hypothetical protein
MLLRTKKLHTAVIPPEFHCRLTGELHWALLSWAEQSVMTGGGRSRTARNCLVGSSMIYSRIVQVPAKLMAHVPQLRKCDPTGAFGRCHSRAVCARPSQRRSLKPDIGAVSILAGG